NVTRLLFTAMCVPSSVARRSLHAVAVEDGGGSLLAAVSSVATGNEITFHEAGAVQLHQPLDEVRVVPQRRALQELLAEERDRGRLRVGQRLVVVRAAELRVGAQRRLGRFHGGLGAARLDRADELREAFRLRGGLLLRETGGARLLGQRGGHLGVEAGGRQV